MVAWAAEGYDDDIFEKCCCWLAVCCLRRVRFLKNDIPLRIVSDFLNFLQLPSRVLAGVLPPAGQIFEKQHPFQNVEQVFSTNLGSIVNYPGEYVQLPWGVF